ncbi:MAG: MerR family transcriptional regulator [Flavobacteriales bacterium]|nr:MerR family transcriptional regulator [Flavobacteriales bacterium]
MGPFLMRFHIRDLEQFTGVKAHTIRVWERRYGLLKPDRTETNIRTYDLDELKEILNVAYLNQHGHKISKIAAMPPAERERIVRSTIQSEDRPEGILNTLVIAMLAFEEDVFERCCDDFEREHGFRALMEEILVKLMERIGLLWQSSAICPAQEHFVSNLVRQRLIRSTHGLAAPTGNTTYVLFLPENEIHELGLLYLNYLLRVNGERTIYLGQSVPRQDLRQLVSLRGGDVVFVGLLIVQPSTEEALGYLRMLRMDMPEQRVRFVLAGYPVKDIAPEEAPRGFRLFPDLSGIIGELAGPR